MGNKLTIGIPTYNDIRFIERTLSSAVQQADEIIISDNDSTDGTSEVCQRFAEKYQNIRYIHQQHNLGAAANFWFVFKEAKTDYFMWLGGHDVIPEGYANELLAAFAAFPDIASAYAPAHRLRPDYSTKHIQTFDELAVDLSSESADVRVMRIVASLNDCFILHGIYRRSILAAAISAHDELLPFTNFFFSDHLLLSEVARRGRMIRVSSTGIGAMDNHYEQWSNLSTMEAAFARVKAIAQSMHPDSAPHELNIAEFRIGTVAAQYFSALKMVANGATQDNYFPNKVLVAGVQHLLSWLCPISDHFLSIKPGFERYVYDTIFMADYLVQYRNEIINNSRR